MIGFSLTLERPVNNIPFLRGTFVCAGWTAETYRCNRRRLRFYQFALLFLFQSTLERVNKGVLVLVMSGFVATLYLVFVEGGKLISQVTVTVVC